MLQIYKIEKQEPSKLCKEMQQRIDNWLWDETEDSLSDDRDTYFDESIKEKKAFERAVQKFINNFEQIEFELKLIKVSEEDEPEAWQKEKLLIINYLKSL